MAHLSFDPEVAAALAPMMEAKGNAPKLPAGDLASRRTQFAEVMPAMFNMLPTPVDVVWRDYHATTADGHSILLRWYTKTTATSGGGTTSSASTPGPAVLYIHGGGMVLADVPTYDKCVQRYVTATGVPMLSVDFRNAPEHPGPGQAEDCLVGLTWLRDHAEELHVDPKRIAVMGDSGGGGIAAATALLARDRNFSPPLAKQILIYPMLDDRNVVPDPLLEPFALWSYDDNVTAWAAIVGKSVDELRSDKYKTTDDGSVSYHTAPARVKDLKGLPPTYVEVGSLDIFRDEDIDYALRCAKAGIAVELHVHPGAPHAFEGFAPLTKVALRSKIDRERVITSF